MKIICIGKNYIEEIPQERPEPIVFLKPDSAILPKKMPFFIPPFSNEVYYEVEVLVKINKVGKFIQPKFAPKYYDEIGLGIDFTVRDVWQKCQEQGLSWEKAKAFDGSAVIGQFYPKEEFNLEDISFQLLKNDEVVQNGNTANMLWNIDELISYFSQYFTLKKGDIIFTGTPVGVGKVSENDILTGIIDNKQAFEIKVK
ncbi:MAG: fumarylacetoacetate hydrolase family protein [Tenacibaculum sp.]|nr:fumarylacetoacetate hydrolase family protein [Tenacibaculum sp.]